MQKQPFRKKLSPHIFPADQPHIPMVNAGCQGIYWPIYWPKRDVVSLKARFFPIIQARVPAFTGLAKRVKSGRGGRAFMRAGLREVFSPKYKRLLKELKKRPTGIIGLDTQMKLWTDSHFLPRSSFTSCSGPAQRTAGRTMSSMRKHPSHEPHLLP